MCKSKLSTYMDYKKYLYKDKRSDYILLLSDRQGCTIKITTEIK